MWGICAIFRDDSGLYRYYLNKNRVWSGPGEGPFNTKQEAEEYLASVTGHEVAYVYQGVPSNA